MSTATMSSHEAWLRTQLVRFHRLIVAAKRHMPKWMAAVIAVALLIPGPQDELLVALIIAVWAAVKPAMRADIRTAWLSVYGSVI
jgi:hypothetical protein